MVSVSGPRPSFFPKADAAVLQTKYQPPSERPVTIGPIFDVENATQAIQPWSAEAIDLVYPNGSDGCGASRIPHRNDHFQDRYLFPVLTRNERLRLTTLWYYTRGSLEDLELQSRLQEKVHYAQESIGWEISIVGLLDYNTYTCLGTIGHPVVILPRRETICAHTVNQSPGAVFTLPNLLDDWRFQHAPHIDIAGIRAYAGAPLRFETEFGDCVALGSLCVLSKHPQKPLTEAQEMSLVRLADWVVADIVQSARTRRQRERRRMLELISSAKQQRGTPNLPFQFEDAVLDILKEVYPDCTINIQASEKHQIQLQGRDPISASDLEHGLWEDSEFLDHFIEDLNHQDPPPSRAVRIIAADCAYAPMPTLLIVATNDVRLVFDDVDSWFVQTCASMLSQIWQNRQLKEAWRAKDSFLRGITHQLRTPIHGILGSVELLAEELKSRNLLIDNLTTPLSAHSAANRDRLDAFSYINTIRASGKELISTVNSIIKLNRWTDIAQAQRVDSLHRFTELESELLNELHQAVSEDVLTRSSLFFDYKLPPDCDSLTMDMCLLQDCVLPLVINSLQHTINGVVAVTISVTEDYQALTIDVQDTGCGIHPRDQRRIFDPYDKVDTQTTGAGLGLTLASKVATLLNGNVSLISSELGKGSHFRAEFHDPVCASSSRPIPRLKDKYNHLPSKYHDLASPSNTPALSHYFAKFLTHHGFASSDTPETSFLLLDYLNDAEQLRSQLSLMAPQQVAFCMVPSSEPTANFGRVRRENNVIYVKGPFLSSVLEEALQTADEIVFEASHSKKEVPTNGITLNDDAGNLCNINTQARPQDLTLEAEYTTDIHSPQATKALTKLLGTLHIDTNPTVPVIPHLPRPSHFSALLVDDNAINLRIMQMYCSKRKIPYHCAIDGLQAISIFSNLQSSPNTNGLPPIELILMDLQMPHCDGIEACRQIRALEKENGWRESVMFIVTGQDSPEDRRKSDEAGADGYFVKPVGPKVLDKGIKQWFTEWDVS